MIFAPPFAGSVSLQALDLAADAHDLRLQSGELPIPVRLHEREQASEALGLRQGVCGFGEPIVLA